MSSRTIPPPTEDDVVIARALMRLTNTDRAALIVAQLKAEVRWLHNIIQQRGNDNDDNM